MKITRQMTAIYTGDGTTYDKATTVTGHATNQVAFGAGDSLPPYACVGHKIYFEDLDNYVKGYTISAVAATTITFLNPDQDVITLVGGDLAWKIKASSSTQRLKILGWTIPFTTMGEGQEKREAADSDPT